MHQECVFGGAVVVMMVMVMLMMMMMAYCFTVAEFVCAWCFEYFLGHQHCCVQSQI
jgi:hypothetical protein